MNNTIDAKTRTPHAASLPPHAARLRRKLLPVSLSLLLASPFVFGGEAMAAAVGATSGPTGGTVVGGVGSITQNGANTVINQNSARLALDWQTFNVGKDASVKFNQPSFNAVALNRILDQNPSQIFGHISSNGQVFLINTHGIIFGASAQLNVGGLMASTLDLTPKDFLASRYNLDAHGERASIVNHGLIQAASGGSVSLVGGSVANDGVILANYGRINLDGADRAVLDFDGNGLINIQVTGALKQRLDGSEAAVSNRGTLKADSGTVVLQASAAKDLFTNLVNNSGVIDAGGISTQGGVVRLVAAGGNTENSGAINVSGAQGGSVQLLSDQNVSVTGHVDASGSHGGGSIRVGGGYQGGEGLQAAAVTYVGPGASLNADAVDSGNGGSVVLWSNTATGFKGSISARGGAAGGNGGMAEVSSLGYLAFDGFADLRAPHGAWGTLLLDPNDITISDDVDANPVAPGGFDASGAFTPGDATAASTINTATIVTQLGSSDVNIKTTDGDITVVNGFTYNGDNDRTLTLDAFGTLTFKNGAVIQSTGGTGGTHTLGGDLTGTGGVVFEAGSSFITNGGDLAVNGGAFTLDGALDAGAGTVTLDSSDAISQTGGVITAGTLTGSSVGATTLDGTNAVDALGDFSAASFSLTNGAALTIAGDIVAGDPGDAGADPVVPPTAGNITLSATGALTQGTGSSLTSNGGDISLTGSAMSLSGTLDASNSDTTGDVSLASTAGGLSVQDITGDTVSLNATGGGITQTDGLITAATLTGSATGDVTLNRSTNAIATLDDFSAANIWVANSTGLTLAGNIVAGDAAGTPVVPGNITLSAGGVITQNAGTSLVSNGGDISLTGNAVTLSGTLDASNPDITGDVTLTSGAGGLSVQDITGDTVTMNATGGGITQTDGVITAATLTGSAAGDATLNRSTNVIAKLDGFSAANISLANSTALTLAGNIVAGDAGATPAVAGNITLSAGGVITQDAGSSLASNGGDISVTGSAVTLNGTLDASNPDTTGDVSLTSSAGGLSVQDITGDTVTMNATGGGITQTDGLITAAVLTGSASGDLTLNRSTNVIAALDDFSAANIWVANSTLLTIAGNIVAGDAGGTPVVPGNITLSSGGVITQSASSSLASNGGDISITGSATGPGSTLILDGTLDAGSGAVSLSTAAGDLTLGGDVTGATVTLIADNGSVDGVDGSIKQTAGSITATDVTLNATGGVQLGQIDAANMEVSAAGDITQLGGASDALLISGTSHLDAGAHAITLDNTSNHFTGAVSLTNSGAHDVTLDNGSNALVLGNLQVGSGTLTVSGRGITQAASTAITQAAAAGAAQFDAGAGALQLGNANTLTGAVSLANSGANNVTLNNGSNALTLGTSTLGSGAFDLTGTGPTTLAGNLTTSGGAITLSGPVTLGAASTGINTTGGGATTGAAITFSGTVDGASTLTLNAGTAGAVTLDGAVGATTALTGLDVTAGSFSAKALNIGSGGLAVTTQAGDITQGGGFTVAGTSSFDAGAHAITLNNAGNHFTGAVSLTNSGVNDVTLDNGGNALVLGDVQVGSGTLTVSGVGITQASGSAITQTAGAGAAQFNAGAGVLQLDNANTLTGTVSLNNSGNHDVTLDNGSNALVLGDVQVGSGTLSVSGVGITQATGTAVAQAASAGAAQFNAGAGVLQLDNANTLTGAVSLANSGANNVTLNNGSNALTLGTSTLGSGAFNLTGTGPTTLAGNLTTSGGAITLSGPVTLGAASTGINTTGGGATTGAAITFSGTVDGASTLTLNAGTAGAVTLDGAVGATTALTGLDVTAGSFSAKALNIGSGGLAVTTQAGDITQGGAFTVSGASSFDAGAHAITLANTGNHFTGAVSLANSGANNVTLDNGSNALVLGDVQVGSGTLTVSGVGITQAAGSAITQAAGAGAAQFNAGAGVLQLGNANTLTGAVSLNNSGANDVALDNGTHALTLGTSTLGSGAFSLEGSGQTTLAGDLTTSGGAITLSGPVTLGSSTTGIHTTGGGATTGAAITFDGALDGASGLTLDAGTAGVVTLGGAVGASTALTGLTVTAGSFSANALNIGSGGLSVTTQAGDITQGGTGAFTVAGTSNFTAMNGHQITLDNTDNDFQAGVTATGTGVSITDTNDLTIDALNNGSNGTVSLIAGGALLLPTGAIDTGTADLTLAANGGTLVAPGALSGANVTLSSQGDITLSDAVTATGTLSLTSLAGAIGQSTTGSLTATELTGSSHDGTALDGTNHIASLGNFTANGFSLTNSQGLSVTGVVDGGASTALTTTSGDLTVDGTLKGTTVTLTSAGAIGEGASGVIDATTLKGSSQGNTVLGGANRVDTLDNFSAANFTLVNAQGLATSGALTTTGGTGSIGLTTTSGALSLGSDLTGGAISLDSADGLALANNITATTVELISSGGGISQSAGIITAGTLSGSAADGVALGQLNQVAALGNFDAAGFSLTNGAALVVSGVVDGGSSAALTTQAGDLTINGTLRGTIVTLTSAGAIGEGGTGVIEAATLTGTSQGNTVLGGANRVDALGNFDAANLTFVNAQDLAANGPLTTAGDAGTISLKTSSGTLSVNSDLTASAVTLDSADDLALAHAIDASVVALAAGGDISQSSGVITAGTLTGQSTGTTTLGGANLVGTLGSFKASNFSLVNAAGLSVNGPLQITSPSGGVSLKTTAGILTVNSVLSAGAVSLDSAGNLALAHEVSGGLVTLASGGNISQTASGKLTATTLTGHSTGSTTLNGSGNRIGTLGSFTAAGFGLTNSQSLSVAGPVNGGASTSLATAAGNLAINGAVSGTTTAFDVAGNLTQGAGGVITATTLRGTAGGVVTLGGNNRIDTLGDFSAAGFSLKNVQDLTVAGPVNGGASVGLATTGNLVINGTLTGATTTLDVTGAISEASAGGIVAATLNGDTTGAVSLTGNNRIGALGDFSAAYLNLGNAQSLTVAGTVDGGTSTTLTTTSGDLTVDGTLKGTTVTLTSAGAIGEGASGVIDATTLTGSSQGDTVLDGANLVDTLDNFSAANFTLVNAQGLATTGALTTTGGTGSISLTTSSGALSLGSNLSGGAISLDSADSLALAKDITGTTVELISSGGGISQSAGIITAGTLSGSAADGVALGQLNQVAALGNFDAAGFSLTNGAALVVSGVVDGGSSTALTTTTGNLTVNGTLKGTAVTLTSAAAIGEGGSGVIEASTLTGSSQGDTLLGGANLVDTLDSFDAANFTFVNAQDLAANGPLTTAGDAGTISLKTSSGTLSVNSDLTSAAVALSSADDLALTHDIDASSVSLAAGGDISQGSTVITAGTLTGQSTGTTVLDGANLVGTLGSFKAADFSLVNAAGLSVNGPLQITSPSGGVSLTTTSGILTVNSVLSAGAVSLDSAGSLALAHEVSGGLVTLASGGNISQTASGKLTATTLTGHSTGSTMLNGSGNRIGTLGSFTAAGFGLTNSQSLAVAGPVNGGASTTLATSAGNLAINGAVSGTTTAFDVAGNISQGAGSVITANTLRGNAGGAVALGGNNRIDTLGDVNAAGFSLKNVQDLTVAGAVNGGASAGLATTGNLVINGTLTGATTTLDVTGAISEASTGSIVAGTLKGDTSGAVSLTGNNRVGALGDFSAAYLNLRNALSLTVAGTVNGGTSTTLTTTSGDLMINGALKGTAMTLDSAGAIGQGSHGVITAATLSGRSTGVTALNGANHVGTLGSFAAAGLDLTNAQALAVNGPLTIANGGRLHLTTTSGLLSVNTAVRGGDVGLASAGDLTLTQAVQGDTVTLVSGGDIRQTASGIITAGTLGGRSAGSTVLDPVNHVDALGSFSAEGFDLATDRTLTVTGPVDGGDHVNLTTTNGDIVINGLVSGTRTALTSAGAIRQGASGGIAASTLTGRSAGATALDGSGNRVATLEAFKAAGFSFTNGQSLIVAGPIDGGARTTLTTTRGGDLSIDGAVQGGMMTLVSAGAINEGASGKLTADTLTGSAASIVTLGDAAHPLANYIGTLGGFAAPAGFRLTNAQTLNLASVNGSKYTVDAGTSSTYLSVTNGDLLQSDQAPLYNGVGVWASTGHIGLGGAPVYVVGDDAQVIVPGGISPAYFYAVDRQGNILPLTGGSSINVPTSALTSRAQNTNRHTDSYIDPSVISANYRAFGIVPTGLLLPPDQQRCAPDAVDCDDE